MVTPATTTEPVLPVVESTPAAPVQITPAVTPAPTTPPPAATGVAMATPAAPAPPFLPAPPSEVEILRRQLADFQAERQAQEAEATLTQEARAVQQQALARGLSEEDAQWMANNHYSVAKRVMQERQQLREQQSQLQGKQNAALIIGGQYGVSPGLLMSASTPEEMHVIAQREKHYASLEADLRQLKQAQVPPQTLNAVNGTRASGIAVTNDNIDKLYMDFEAESTRLNQPGRVNPYEAQYRTLVFRR